jgi:hypothetical protein
VTDDISHVLWKAERLCGSVLLSLSPAELFFGILGIPAILSHCTHYWQASTVVRLLPDLNADVKPVTLVVAKVKSTLVDCPQVFPCI